MYFFVGTFVKILVIAAIIIIFIVVTLINLKIKGKSLSGGCSNCAEPFCNDRKEEQDGKVDR